jgi:hypothetical protein
VKRRILIAAAGLLLAACAPERVEFYSTTRFPTARYAFFQSPRGGGEAAGFAIAVDRLGRILVAGEAEDRGGELRLAVWRFSDVGVLDREFGDRGFVVSRLPGPGTTVAGGADGMIRASGERGSLLLDHKGGILEEKTDSGAAAAFEPPELRLEAGVSGQGVLARTKTGRVERFAGWIETPEGIRAALWGRKGEELRLRRLPGGEGGEDRALAIAAYESGRLAAAGFSRGAGGRRRLAIWTVP